MRTISTLGLMSIVLISCNDVQVTAQANVGPAVAIESPETGSNFFDDAAIEFVGNVQDGNGLEDVTLVTWTSSELGPLGFEGESDPETDGTTSIATLLPIGTHIITLSATDGEGLADSVDITVTVLSAVQEPTVEITSPTDFELYYPWEEAVLSAAVSDNQDSNEALITRWYGGPQNGTGTLIIQQNAHTSGTSTTVWNPGAVGNYMVRIEVEDTDGNISEDSTVITFAEDRGPDWDDDGDCYCEGPMDCSGSSSIDCPDTFPGDCHDGEELVNPSGGDVPDMQYLDGNCDGIDGDAASSVFMDPLNGLDSNDGRNALTPVRSLDTAYAVANADGMEWILISGGDVALSGDFEAGVNLAGGYTAGTWTRSGATIPSIPVSSAGKTLSGWTVATTWQQLEVVGADATGTGASAYSIILSSTAGLLWESVHIESGDATNGSSGSVGSNGQNGGTGGNGGGGCEDSSTFCSDCNTPGRGGGGSSPAAATGGRGGSPGYGGGGGGAGAAGGPSSTGGAGGTGNSNNGGGVGASGSTGGAGAGGVATGSFSGASYTPSNGVAGGNGTDGKGGGGGGGGKGGDSTCDSWGGAGAGGGGGAKSGTGGSPGTGGGASVALAVINSSLEMRGGSITTGAGGDGGSGANGGNGATGGGGGNGGGGHDDGTPGGPGGRGGNSGAGGDAGGGGGGPVLGILCDGGSVTTDGAEVYRLGAPGTGGDSRTYDGAAGAIEQRLGCP